MCDEQFQGSSKYTNIQKFKVYDHERHEFVRGLNVYNFELWTFVLLRIIVLRIAACILL